MKLDEEKTLEFFEILKEQAIRSVFQPIFSLKNGEVFAYEALSRITKKNTTFQISELFETADKLGQVWNLEKICRAKALKASAKKPSGKKIFLNVDANVILDIEFVEGFTKKFLEKFGLKTDDIVFELTERTSVENAQNFRKVVEHYKMQGFEIAIDDAGSGYSNLNRITCIEPKYIKLDIELIKNIHINKVKSSIVGILSRFSKEMGYVVIAEGIESEDELRELIRLGVSYGQGYLLKKPSEQFTNIEKITKVMLMDMQIKENKLTYIPSFFGNIETICKPGIAVLPESKAIDAFSFFKQDESLLEICVVDHQGKFCGMITRNEALLHFGGLYGYNLNHKKCAQDIMQKNALIVSTDFLIENVSKMAMERVPKDIYNAVVVLKNGYYFGIATIKNLLSTAVTIQVKRATEANPLTALPGNTTIEYQINQLIGKKDPYAIMYLDLDNFKAYNDAYGFNSGDRMIKAVAESMKNACKEEFLGHIGGDDFVIITKNKKAEKIAKQVIKNFQSYLSELYSKNDWDRGYIISKNRNGLTEQFPIASLSIAIVTNWKNTYDNIEALSEKIVDTKKKAKKIKGNSIVLE